MKHICALALTITLCVITLFMHQAPVKADTNAAVYLPLVVRAATSTPSTPTPTPQPTGTAILRAQVVDAVNAERAKIGCAPAVVSDSLTTAAQAWSDYMRDHNYIQHSSTVDAQWYLHHGYTATDWISENIAGSFPTGDQAVAAWMGDEAHKATILQGCADGNVRVEIGVGANPLWTLATGEIPT